MENIRVHFAKFLGQTIWDKLKEKDVILCSVNIDSLTVMDGYSCVEENAEINDFSFIVGNVMEAINKRLPIENCVIIREKAIICEKLSINNESILKNIKSIVHDKAGVTELDMAINQHSRKSPYMEARQVIMATYYTTLHQNGVSLTTVGNLYKKNHATVINAIEKVQNMVDTDKIFRGKYVDLWEFIYSVNPHNELRVKL